VTALRYLALVLSMAWPVLARAQSSGGPRRPAAHRDTATVVTEVPTVVAYLVVPAGAVDSSAALAVLADDWNVAMATLGDSLSAHGIRLALVTQPMLRVRSARRRDLVLALDAEPAAGYVFVGPGMAPCLRRGAADIDEVLRAARTTVDSRTSSAARARAGCSARAR
jgi:hypothetical protein